MKLIIEVLLTVCVLFNRSYAAWNLVWSDEFNETTLNDDEWKYNVGGKGWGNGELEYYTEKRQENSRIEDGHLVIDVKVEDYEGRHFTSTRLSSKKAWTFGKFEARAKLPKGKNLWPAIWMMPQDSVYGGWAASGEIDIMEARGERETIIMGTIHYGAKWPYNQHSGSGEKNFIKDLSADWHTYGLEWEKKEMRWYFDGEEYHKENLDRNMSSKHGNYDHFGAPFDQAFHWNLNIAVGGNFFPTHTFGAHITPEEAKHWAKPTMQIDYLRVYEQK